MKILKFGGTSVGSAASIKLVEQIIKREKDAGTQFIVVVSALGGVTNLLLDAAHFAAKADQNYKPAFKKIEDRHIELCQEIISVHHQGKTIAKIKRLLNDLEDILQGVFLIKELTARTTDLVASFGERMSAIIIADYLNQLGIEAAAADARAFIRTDSQFGNANVQYEITNERIRAFFSNLELIPIVTGFIGSTMNDETSTLGRGGSDFTAAILAGALDANLIEIWTDVPGMLTADPRVVQSAFTLPNVTYQEAMELSHFGAKVIYPPTLQPAFAKNIPIDIKNTFEPENHGTRISRETNNTDYVIRGISSIPEVAMLNVQGSGLVGVAGVAGRLFHCLAQAKVNVILISQASSEHSIAVAIDPKQAETAKKAIETEFDREIESGKMDRVAYDTGISLIAVIGENMRHSPGVSGKIFGTLGQNGINVIATAQGSSELNVSIAISSKNLAKALNALHETFFISDTKTINLFIVGPGLIGSTLIKQIEKQSEFLRNSRKIRINVAGIANSKQMLLKPEGIGLENWKEVLEEDGEPVHIETFVRKAIKLNLSNSVVADCTAGFIAIPYYEKLLRNSISIVTPNKQANSGPFERYKKLQDAALKHNARFLYETNVGAGLPIVNTLKDLIFSGDEIIKIEAVLSGTVSYIFNNYKEGRRFSDVVKEAQDMGYTEPDPRDDLSGVDMARKVLILARECGLFIEPEQVEIENILPEACLKAPDIAAFYRSLENENAYFENLAAKAKQASGVLRFIGVIENGSVKVKLQIATAESPFYAMTGSDNMIAFNTQRYLKNPLVVKGPGAGSEVTAAGVFAEIISTVR